MNDRQMLSFITDHLAFIVFIFLCGECLYRVELTI